MNEYHPLSPKELEQGYFLLSHRDLFKKIGLAFGILLTVIIYVVLLISLIKLLQNPSWDNLASQVANSRANWSGFHQGRGPLPIVSAAAQYVSLGDRRYDLVAFINNPNNDWALVEFEYNFVINGQPLETQTSFLNPGEDRLIAKIGHQSDEGISGLQLNIGNMKWQRVSANDSVIDWEITDVRYQPVSRQTVGEESFVVAPRVTWSARNMSLYDFWEVPWQVVLLNGDKIIGVKETKVPNWGSLQTKQMELVWLEDLPRVTKTLVYPALNWLDNDNYKNR